LKPRNRRTLRVLGKIFSVHTKTGGEHLRQNNKMRIVFNAINFIIKPGQI